VLLKEKIDKEMNKFQVIEKAYQDIKSSTGIVDA